jgi:hypothetical protein
MLQDYVSAENASALLVVIRRPLARFDPMFIRRQRRMIQMAFDGGAAATSINGYPWH